MIIMLLVTVMIIMLLVTVMTTTAATILTTTVMKRPETEILSQTCINHNTMELDQMKAQVVQTVRKRVLNPMEVLFH